jgi:hypothetical protein
VLKHAWQVCGKFYNELKALGLHLTQPRVEGISRISISMLIGRLYNDEGAEILNHIKDDVANDGRLEGDKNGAKPENETMADLVIRGTETLMNDSIFETRFSRHTIAGTSSNDYGPYLEEYESDNGDDVERGAVPSSSVDGESPSNFSQRVHWEMLMSEAMKGMEDLPINFVAYREEQASK